MIEIVNISEASFADLKDRSGQRLTGQEKLVFTDPLEATEESVLVVERDRGLEEHPIQRVAGFVDVPSPGEHGLPLVSIPVAVVSG